MIYFRDCSTIDKGLDFRILTTIQVHNRRKIKNRMYSIDKKKANAEDERLIN